MAFNRLSEQFDTLRSQKLKASKAIFALPLAHSGEPVQVAAGGRAKVCMTLPLSAIFGAQQTKISPIFALHGGIELLMTIAAPSTHLKTGGGKSSAYRLEAIQMHIGLITLDSQLQEDLRFARQGPSHAIA